MTEKELQAERNKSQSLTNILNEVFEFKWDGLDYSVEKWETKSFPFYLAEHAAFHMARKICTKKGTDFHKEWGKIVDKILGKEFIEYNKLTLPQATELAKDRKISLENTKGIKKTKTVLVAELKATH